MNASLSGLTYNLSEINKNKCKSCKERKNTSINCIFIELKDKILTYKSKECNNKSYKSIDALKIKFPDTYQFCNNDNNKFLLLLRKGVYPYEYMDGWDKFDETILPPKKEFYNKLNLEDITDEDYKHAQKVWDTFNIKNFGEYHDLYVQSDTLLLADIYENFRNVCINICELDPAHFLSAPGLAWQACLKKTKIKLDLLTDINMLLMIEEGIRGGICQAIHHYATANNKYMKNYNKNIILTFLQYLDASNLYGWAMSKKLPVGKFEWIHPSDYTEDHIKNYDNNDEYGAILEVDIEYPKELSNKHKDVPFLPERRKINRIEKLVTTLENKEKCIVHISTLKQALDHGLKFKKVHRVIEFKQEAWLKPYIDMNIKLGTEAKTDFEKDFFKLMNNSVFGKTIANVRNHRNIKLVTTNEKKRNLVSKSNYHVVKHFSEDLTTIEIKKTKVVMNKPIYLGQAILDISKTLMYELWYDYLKLKYRDKVKLCFMGTDSFIIHIET